MAHGGRARGEMGVGGAREQCGSNKNALVPPFGLPKNLTTGLIWLVTRVGGMGGGVGRWPMEGGQGGRWGGGTREQCGSNKNALVPPFGLP